jgi:UDP-N-acetylmuramate dehydrogenase
VGATPIQNVGAYGQEVSETILEVRAISLSSGQAQSFDKSECQFGYRDSFFKSQEPESWVVVSVRYQLNRGTAPQLRYAELVRHFEEEKLSAPSLSQVHDAVLTLRRRKSMVLPASDANARSCGSFFVNPIVSAELLAKIQSASQAVVPSYPVDAEHHKLPAAWLIEQAGLKKGARHGNVGLSSKHALALVSHAGASARELIDFGKLVRARVFERFAVTLVPEPNFWGFSKTEQRLPL